MSPATPTRGESERDQQQAVSPPARAGAPIPRAAPAESRVHRPQPPPVAYWLSSLLTLAALVAAVVGVFFPGVFRDPATTAGNAQGTSLVILVVAIPAVVAGMLLTAREPDSTGAPRAEVVWLGALGYLAYNGVIFAFDTAFNELFLAYVAMLSLAVWSLVVLLSHADVTGIRAAFRHAAAARAIAACMLAVAALFAFTWLSQIIPALVTHGVPSPLVGTKMLTSPVHVLDLGFLLPVTVLAAIWLWQRRPWGYFLAGVMLVLIVIETASIATDQWFGHLHDPSAPLATVPMFAVFTLIGLVPTVALLWHLRRSDEVPSSQRTLRP